MRHSCQKAFFLLAAATIACGDPLSPRPVVSAYVLESINGQPLPFAMMQPIPEETITVLHGTLTLYVDSRATSVERRREHPLNNPEETTYTRESGYRVDGNRIWIGVINCPPNALCVAPSEGFIVGSTLTLNVRSSFTDAYLIYQYQLVTPL